MASNNGRQNLRTQPLYLPNDADPTQFNVPESDWRYPGMIGGTATFVFGTAGSATNPRGSKNVQLVRTDSTMTTAPYSGASAWWKNKLIYQVTTDPTSRRGQIAGVFLGPVTPGRLAIIQTGGRHGQVKFIDAVTSTPDATGKIVIPSATAGKADCLAAGTAATYPALGVTAGTYDAVNAVCAVDLNIPQVT
jgi:hypothetical protein